MQAILFHDCYKFNGFRSDIKQNLGDTFFDKIGTNRLRQQINILVSYQYGNY